MFRMMTLISQTTFLMLKTFFSVLKMFPRSIVCVVILVLSDTLFSRCGSVIVSTRTSSVCGWLCLRDDNNFKSVIGDCIILKTSKAREATNRTKTV